MDNFKLPDIVEGKVIPHSVRKDILKSEQQKHYVKNNIAMIISLL